MMATMTVGGLTKRQRILQLHSEGMTDVLDLAREVATSMSYVRSMLSDAGLKGTFNAINNSEAELAATYGHLFQGALNHKNIEAAKASVSRIDQIYRYFAFIGDAAGQHHTMLVALTGRNHALVAGKKDEAAVFAEWLVGQLTEVNEFGG